MITNIGYLNQRTSKKGNKILIGELDIPKFGKIRVLIPATPNKKGSFSVGLLSGDEQAEGAEKAAGEKGKTEESLF